MYTNDTSLSGKIAELLTRFFYRENRLMFQILVGDGKNEAVTYREYSDYNTYKEDFLKLKKIKENSNLINLSDQPVSSSNLELKVA